METGKKLIFGGKEYQVLKRLYKSRGSVRQTLELKPDKRTEPNKAYYIVERRGVKYWVKERVIPVAPEFNGFGTIKDEYERMVAVKGIVVRHDNISVRSVIPHACVSNKILMEYVEEYVSLRAIRNITNKYKLDAIERVAREWLEKTALTETFDLCDNNILLTNQLRDIVLVDFELADGKSKLK